MNNYSYQSQHFSKDGFYLQKRAMLEHTQGFLNTEIAFSLITLKLQIAFFMMHCLTEHTLKTLIYRIIVISV